MAEIIAQWHISLTVVCPNCEQAIDLTKVDGFWDWAQVAREDLDAEVECPMCRDEFKADFVY